VAMCFELVVMPLMALWLSRIVATHAQSKPW
jgi:hypothetical protein